MATMRITPDAELLTVTAVKFRINQLQEQGLGDSLRVEALRRRLPETGEELLPLPVLGKAARLVQEGGKHVIVMPSGFRSNPSALAQDMPNLALLVEEGRVDLRAMVYKNFGGGTGEDVFKRAIDGIEVGALNGGVVTINETEQTDTAQLRGAFTGEVIIDGVLSDVVQAEIEPFLVARQSKKRGCGRTTRIYNNPLYLIVASLKTAVPSMGASK